MTDRKDDKLWGGRFDRGPDKVFDEFQRSFSFDHRLLPFELAVNRAWTKALQGVGILTGEEVEQIHAALDRIDDRIAATPAWIAESDAEDLHHFTEKALVEELGPLAWKVHTGRSRNELVATDFRLFVMESAAAMQRRADFWRTG